MWDLIVSVPDHCLSFYSVSCQCTGGTSILRETRMAIPKPLSCKNLYKHVTLPDFIPVKLHYHGQCFCGKVGLL